VSRVTWVIWVFKTIEGIRITFGYYSYYGIYCTGFSRTCTPTFITIYRLSVCLSGLNSKFAMIEGFWVQFLQKSKLELKLNITVVRENPVLPFPLFWNSSVISDVTIVSFIRVVRFIRNARITIRVVTTRRFFRIFGAKVYYVF
jgi:hypothetical protein